MSPNNHSTLTISALLFALVAGNANATPTQLGQTTGPQSPTQNCISSTCNTTYTKQVKIFEKERIGKKLAVRSIYLIPIYDISRKICGSEVVNCKDTYEVAFIYLELQSIWPEPFLLTAAKVNINTRSNAIHTDAGMSGRSVLTSQITKSENPSDFLFQPGEIKFIGLSQGIKLDGVLDFFRGEIRNDLIWADITPVLIPHIGRVTEFNRFMQQRFGKNTSIRIRLFEKDYQPILTTDVQLGQGSDLFAHGDILSSRYQFKHDAFIGEVLYQLNGGTEAFEHRHHNGTKNSNVRNNLQ